MMIEHKISFNINPGQFKSVKKIAPCSKEGEKGWVNDQFKISWDEYVKPEED